VLKVGSSTTAILENAHGLARYAQIAQVRGRGGGGGGGGGVAMGLGLGGCGGGCQEVGWFIDVSAERERERERERGREGAIDTW